MTTELSQSDASTFTGDGALRLRSRLDGSELRRLADAVAGLPPDQAGIRLRGLLALTSFLSHPDRYGGRPRRKAHLMETASQISEWLTFPGLRAPR